MLPPWRRVFIKNISSSDDKDIPRFFLQIPEVCFCVNRRPIRLLVLNRTIQLRSSPLSVRFALILSYRSQMTCFVKIIRTICSANRPLRSNIPPIATWITLTRNRIYTNYEAPLRRLCRLLTSIVDLSSLSSNTSKTAWTRVYPV
jgi:hypothetical protein